jgi:hypothetical protein
MGHIQNTAAAKALMVFRKPKRIELGSIAPESQARMTTSQKRLFRNADRTLQDRMVKRNELVVQGSQRRTQRVVLGSRRRSQQIQGSQGLGKG